MRKIKLLLVALIGLVAMGAVGVAPAGANTYMETAHWGTYTWPGAPSSCQRLVNVLDRTNNATQSAALVEFIQAWNNDANARTVAGCNGVPVFAYYQDYANWGVCNDFTAFENWSFMTVCDRGPYADGSWTNTFAPVNYHWTKSNGHFVHPQVWIKSGLSYDRTFTNIAHEFGHVMGLSHEGGGTGCGIAGNPTDMNSVMWCTDAAGPNGVTKKYFNEQNWQTLIYYYTNSNHPASA